MRLSLGDVDILAEPGQHGNGHGVDGRCMQWVWLDLWTGWICLQNEMRVESDISDIVNVDSSRWMVKPVLTGWEWRSWNSTVAWRRRNLERWDETSPRSTWRHVVGCCLSSVV